MRVLVDAVCIRVICKENLLVAIGNQLMLLFLTPNGNTDRILAPLPRLRDKIHGIERCPIRDNEYLIVFHAGREAYSLKLNCSTHRFTECEKIVIQEETCLHPVPYIRRRVNDWISSIALLSPSELCMVTSHGVAVLLRRDATSDSLMWNLAEKSVCEDGSTLYCSSLVGQTWDQILCFSGTALGLLLVWCVSGSNKNRGKVLTSVSAHNGVIFSIACDLGTGLLNTTSDDRSIKFWKLDLTKTQKSNEITVDLHEERYCFAHTARVFQSCIIKNENRILVASIGEDAHLCLWNTDGDLLLKKSLDDGPTLWGMDYDVDTSTIFITASNGNMYKYCIQRWMDDIGDSSEIEPNMDLLDISPELPLDEHLAKVRFASNGSLIAVTNKNHVMMINSNGRHMHTFEVSDQFKCSIIEVGDNYLYLAGRCQIYLYEIKTQGFTCLQEGKVINFNDKAFQHNDVCDFHVVMIRSLIYCNRSKTVAICDANGRCIVFEANLKAPLSYHRLPRSAERWLTAFIILDDARLLMGDRSGYLYLYDRKSIEPTFRLPNVHGKLGITSISVTDQNPGLDYRLLTTGHDSRICEIFLDCTRKSLACINTTKMCMRWIDRVVYLSAGCFYMGFNDAHFLMIDAHNEVYTQFDCGGGHRCWDYYYDTSSDTFTYVFIQHKKLRKVLYNPHRNDGSALSLPRYNWHTRACNALQVSHFGASWFIVSGGEDNLLRINVLVAGELSEEPRKYIFNHISSIKTIAVREEFENGRMTIVSAGGRAQICVTCVELNSLLVRQEYTYMLMETDSERSRWKMNRRSNIDPETKFMCAAFVGAGRLVFGCSDGFVRTYDLLCTDGQWSVALVWESFYGRCILKVVSATIHGKSFFMTMATDGNVCFWDPTLGDEPFYQHRLHNSGVNSVDFKHLGTDTLQLATGGDDQSVTVSLFAVTIVDGTFKVTLIHSLCEKYLHTAQVTGIKLLDNDKMISVGVDQRIHVSSFRGYSKLEVITSTNTCVADVKGLSFIPDGNQLIVYGCGIEIISIEGL